MTAPGVFDGAINGELFLAYVQQILVPTLKRGDIVVMDNPARIKSPVCPRGSRPLAPRGCSFQLTART